MVAMKFPDGEISIPRQNMPSMLDQMATVVFRKTITGPYSCSFRHNLLNKASRCNPLHPLIPPRLSSPVTTTPRRHLSSTTPLLKKGKEWTLGSKTEEFQLGTDPFDFSELDARIQESLDWLKAQLGRLRPGGRFNPETIELLRVVLKKKDGDLEAVRLRELAQVLPRGGLKVVVLVGEEEVSSDSSIYMTRCEKNGVTSYP